MSLNAAIAQEYLVETQALLSLLEQYMIRWQGAATLEQKLLIESDAISTFDRLMKLQLYVDDVVAGQHPDLTDMGRVYSDWDFLVRLNSAKVQKLMETFLLRFNSQRMALMELTSMMKRIRQKRASLSLWTRDKARYVLAEHFLNFDSLDSRFTSVTECDVDTNQGVLTLPVKNRQLLTPKTARVGSGSNGQPGNSDEAVQTNNSNPTFAINRQEGNWFEYERLDTGPVDLNFVVEFSQPQIINHITVEPVNLGLSLAYDIEDITFTVSGSTEVSIHDLTSGAFDEDIFTVKPVGNDIAWVLSFLPVQASTVTIKFRQRQHYPILASSADDRAVQRRRFAIALKDISFYRLEYDRLGGINSKVLDLPGGLYAAIPFADVWPQNSSFFTEFLEVSSDGGATWTSTNLPLTPGSDPSTVLLQGDEKTFMWRVSLERNDEAFKSLTSFIELPDPLLKTSSIQRAVSRYQSPVDVSLPEAPMDGRVFAIQPKIARRGNRYKGIFVGVGGGQSTSFGLPLSLIKKDLKPEELRVFVARREYDRVDDNTVIGNNEWAFSDDYEEILFGSALPDGSRVTVVFKEEKLALEERADGYYHQMKMLFDPDKENIDIAYLPRASKRVSIVLPRDRTVIPLGYKNILRGRLDLTSTNGNTYTEVSTRADVLDAADGDYYVDYVNGMLYMASKLGTDIVKATFLHQNEVELSKDNFEVVIQDNKPWGIRINKEAFAAQSKTETVSSTPGSVISIIDGTYTAREDTFAGSANAKTLTYDCVVKGSLSVSDDLLNTSTPPEEVDFVDGHTEFLGLIPMNDETTIEIESGTNEYVTFSLAARSLWHQPLGVVFSDGSTFSSQKGSASAARTGIVGDYHVSAAGLVTVNVGVGNTLASGIEINYMYRDPSYDPANKYSVDYEEGVLYSHTDLNTDATIEYKAACYRAAYDIAQEIDTYRYNSSANVVSIRTEGLAEINNLVKLIWTQAPETSELLELKDYFSPIISVLAFRFN